MPRLSAAALLLCLCACAAAQRTPSASATCPTCPPGADAPATTGASVPPKVEYPPEEVKVSRLDLELAGKNDEELFAPGTAAFGAADFARAATAFSRLADLFPRSRHEPAALFDAGLAYERLEEWRL